MGKDGRAGLVRGTLPTPMPHRPDQSLPHESRRCQTSLTHFDARRGRVIVGPHPFFLADACCIPIMRSDSAPLGMPTMPSPSRREFLAASVALPFAFQISSAAEGTAKF